MISSASLVNCASNSGIGSVSSPVMQVTVDLKKKKLKWSIME